jgi:TPR repeat protein
MVFLTAAVAISVYHQVVGQGLIWLGEQLGGVQAVQTSPPAAEGAVSTTTSDQAAWSQRSTSAKAKTANPKDASGSAGVPDNQQTSLPTLTQDTPPPVTPLSGVSNFPSSEASQDTGQGEYVQAMQLLRGKNAAIDTPEAVRLLWISVEKGHPSAEVELADLYWHGRGVVRNCDQTRILLSAAARKGNAEAQKRLQQFQREGCE